LEAPGRTVKKNRERGSEQRKRRKKSKLTIFPKAESKLTSVVDGKVTKKREHEEGGEGKPVPGRFLAPAPKREADNSELPYPKRRANTTQSYLNT